VATERATCRLLLGDMRGAEAALGLSRRGGAPPPPPGARPQRPRLRPGCLLKYVMSRSRHGTYSL